VSTQGSISILIDGADIGSLSPHQTFGPCLKRVLQKEFDARNLNVIFVDQSVKKCDLILRYEKIVENSCCWDALKDQLNAIRKRGQSNSIVLLNLVHVENIAVSREQRTDIPSGIVRSGSSKQGYFWLAWKPREIELDFQHQVSADLNNTEMKGLMNLITQLF